MASTSRFAIAVHTLALMANYQKTPLKSEFVACLVKTNAVVVRRLLCELAKADLIESQSGANGGSWLKKSPQETTLWEIYRAVEPGEIFSLHKPSHDSNCQISENIESVLTEIQTKIDSAIEQKLTEIKLSDVLQMIQTEQINDAECQKYQNLK